MFKVYSSLLSLLLLFSCSENSDFVVVPDPDSQISEYIRTMFQDKDGNIWFGTQGDGACVYDPPSPGQLTGAQYLTYLKEDDGLSNNIVRRILQDDNGMMWFATARGVCRWDPRRTGKKAFSYYDAEVNSGPGTNDFWSGMKDSKGTLWFGSLGGTVMRIMNDSMSSFILPLPEVEIPEKDVNPSRFMSLEQLKKRISAIVEDKNGSIWFGTMGGAIQFDPTKKGEKAFTLFTTKDGLIDNDVQCIMEDRSGKIWIGTRNGGISCFDGNTFTNFSPKDGLPISWGWTLLEDKEGMIWIGTVAGGLSCFDPQKKTFTNYSEKDGLGSMHVQSILEDINGNLWFGLSGGVYRLDPKGTAGKKFVNFTR